MALETVVTCPVCKGQNFKPFQTCTDYTTTGEKFNIVQCTACNFLLTSPRPDSSTIGKYYQSASYISHTNSSKTFIDRVYKLVRSFALQWKLRIIQKHKKIGTLLDYGCGTGEFLNTCKNSDWNCRGVEPSAAARHQAAQLTGLPLSSSLSDLSSVKFDVITLWHVLEHVEDLNEKLLELKNCLAEGGIIFIAVPNHESEDAKKYQSYWAGYDVPRHLWHFSQKTMHQLLASHALKVKEVIPMQQDAYYVSLLSEKYKNPNSNFIVNVLRALITATRSNVAAKTNRNYSSLIYIATA